jgi:dephospho-CoA kinase
MAQKDGIRVLALESALIFQSGAHRLVDFMLVVDAPVSTRIKRVVERDGVTRKDVESRIKYQLAPAEMRKQADFVVYNRGSIERLRDSVAEVYRSLISS